MFDYQLFNKRPNEAVYDHPLPDELEELVDEISTEFDQVDDKNISVYLDLEINKLEIDIKVSGIIDDMEKEFIMCVFLQFEDVGDTIVEFSFDDAKENLLFYIDEEKKLHPNFEVGTKESIENYLALIEGYKNEIVELTDIMNIELLMDYYQNYSYYIYNLDIEVDHLLQTKFNMKLSMENLLNEKIRNATESSIDNMKGIYNLACTNIDDAETDLEVYNIFDTFEIDLEDAYIPVQT